MKDVRLGCLSETSLREITFHFHTITIKKACATAKAEKLICSLGESQAYREISNNLQPKNGCILASFGVRARQDDQDVVLSLRFIGKIY